MPRLVSNPPNPWQTEHVELIGEPPVAELVVYEEDAGEVVSTNDSPDLPFRYSVNPYRGCFHACSYCYARPSHQYLGWGAGTDFERRIVVKRNAPERLAARLLAPGWTGELLAFSGVTDCYQPLEASYALTRRCLEVCLAARQPVGVVTKGALVRRDVDLLAELARVASATVDVSLPVADEEIARRLEPSASPPALRLDAIARLAAAGVPVGVFVAPVIPGLTDEHVPETLARAADAGATWAQMVMLRLPAEVEDVFVERLREDFPLRAERVLEGIRDVRRQAQRVGLRPARPGQRAPLGRHRGRLPHELRAARAGHRAAARAGGHLPPPRRTGSALRRGAVSAVRADDARRGAADWLAACAALAALLVGCGGDDPAGARPHVLLVSLDTLRPDHLGCYGHEAETSPALDALAARGVLFEDASSTAPWTLPAHASLLTGAWPARHGVKDVTHRLPAGVPTLAGLLRDAGWRTAAIVNTHYLSKRYGLVRDFDALTQVSELADPGRRGGPTANRAGAIVAEAIRWLRQATRQGDGPVFLFLHLYDAHTDFSPEPDYRARFVPPYDGDLDGSTAGLLALREAGGTLSPEDARHLRALYDAEIRQLDDALAALFAFLERSGLGQQTLVVVTSDHGEEFGEHGGVLHGRTQHQELLAVPLLMAGPGLPPGVRVEQPVSLVDVLPTVLARAGLQPPTGVDGLDLSPLWERPGTGLPQRLLFGEADHNNAEPDSRHAVRRGAHKLLHDRLADTSALYDLAADPGESTDVSAAHPALVDELLAALRRHLEGATTADPLDDLDDQTRAALEGLGYLR